MACRPALKLKHAHSHAPLALSPVPLRRASSFLVYFGGGVRAITRTLNIDANPAADLELLVRVVPAAADVRLKKSAQVYLVGAPAGIALKTHDDGRTTVAIARGVAASRFKLVYAERAVDLARFAAAADLTPFTRGGPGLFPQTFAVKGQLDPNATTKTYAVDVIPLPAENTWKSPPRFGGFDFFPDGKRIAASSWNGDVWIADGIDGDLSTVTWRRFASGMYQTLGLKIVDGIIHTQGRDQNGCGYDAALGSRAHSGAVRVHAVRSRIPMRPTIGRCPPANRCISELTASEVAWASPSAGSGTLSPSTGSGP